jgi:hypothetical protein
MFFWTASFERRGPPSTRPPAIDGMMLWPLSVEAKVSVVFGVNFRHELFSR